MRASVVTRTVCHRHLAAAWCAALILLPLPETLVGQPCNGTPRGASLAYARGKYQEGFSNGIVGSLSGSRVAAGVDAAMREVASDLKGNQADVRFSVILGPHRFQVCPRLGLGFARDNWDYEAGSKVTSTTLAASGGLNVGLEQPVYGEFTLMPFAGVHYRFAATDFSVGAPNIENTAGADTVRTTAIEYGLMGKFRFIYGGVALDRTTKSKGIRPDAARWIIGVSFSDGSASRSRAVGAGRAPSPMRAAPSLP